MITYRLAWAVVAAVVACHSSIAVAPFAESGRLAVVGSFRTWLKMITFE